MSEESSLGDRQFCEKGDVAAGTSRARLDRRGRATYIQPIARYLNERQRQALTSVGVPVVDRRSEQCQVIRAAGASSLAARHFPIGKCALSRPCRALKRRNRTRG